MCWAVPVRRLVGEETCPPMWISLLFWGQWEKEGEKGLEGCCIYCMLTLNAALHPPAHSQEVGVQVAASFLLILSQFLDRK